MAEKTEKKSSWRTTACGIVSIVSIISAAAVLYLDVDPATSPDLAAVAEKVVGILVGMGILSAGAGQLFARDDKVTSEESGAK